MTGVEVEGHRLFRDGRSRIDYAAGYLRHVPSAEFVVADYTAYRAAADVVTLWFPFLTPTPLLAWRLPLKLLAPDRLFRQIHHNLRADGLMFMVNHGEQEFALAEVCCVAAGFRRVGHWSQPGVLTRHRTRPPMASWWKRA